jgi:hypothetical protein
MSGLRRTDQAQNQPPDPLRTHYMGTGTAQETPGGGILYANKSSIKKSIFTKQKKNEAMLILFC